MGEGGPRRLDVRGEVVDDLALAPVVQHLLADGLLAYPTETVYGFGCALRPAALRALGALKRRGDDSPFLVLLPHAGAAPGLTWTEAARELAALFWPGGLTLVLDDPANTFPEGVRSAAGGVAVRVSPHPLARALPELLGGPITSTSANVPGEPGARSGTDALEAGRRLGGDEKLWVLDAGTLPPSPPSTIVDCTGAVPVVLREGAVPLARLRCAVPEIDGR